MSSFEDVCRMWTLYQLYMSGAEIDALAKWTDWPPAKVRRSICDVVGATFFESVENLRWLHWRQIAQDLRNQPEFWMEENYDSRIIELI